MSFSIEPIRAACKANDTNLAAVERKCGISNGSIAKWENAKGTPQIGHLLLISECLNVSLEYLVFGKEKPAPTNEDGLTVSQRQLLQLLPLLTDQEVFVLSSTAQSLIASRKLPGSE